VRNTGIKRLAYKPRLRHGALRVRFGQFRGPVSRHVAACSTKVSLLAFSPRKSCNHWFISFCACAARHPGLPGVSDSSTQSSVKMRMHPKLSTSSVGDWSFSCFDIRR